LALVSALGNIGPAEGQPGSANQAPGKHYTREPVFHLPISIQEKVRSSIREVQLFMKVGSGDWQWKETALPTQRAFTFKAPADGEYWFTLVTVDNKGVAMPSDLNRLTANEIVMVVVDTQAPTFDLQPMKVASGDVLLRCVVNDANPDPTAVKIAYRGSDQGMRALEPQPGMPATFRVPGPEIFASPLHVMVTDLAGNTTASDVNLQEIGAKLWPAPQPAQAAPQPAQAAPQPVQPATTGPLNPQGSPTVIHAGEQNVSITGPGVVQGGTVPLLPAPSVPAFDPRQQQQPAVPSSQALPGSIQRQFINTARASLDYRIDQVGPSGVGKVEVWVTCDQGANWKRLCEDVNRRSPAEFDLPGDGLYGVRVIVTNGNGFGGRQPVPGEQPQLWIEVDTVAPTLQLKEVEPSTNGGTIDLRWLASDKNLGPEPINVYYATRREGPWQPVARGLKNDGLYRWTFPRDMGPQFFVRLEAVDLAGNVARCESPTAIVLDMTEPRASVLGVTSVHQGLQPVGNR